MLTSLANSFQGRLFYDMSFVEKYRNFPYALCKFFFPEMAEEVDAIVPWWNGTDETCELRH